jgi:uncharacterized protein (DUF58 family)
MMISPGPAQDGPAAEGRTRVNLSALVRLSEPAATLSLRPRSIRARQGGSYLSTFKGRGMEFDESRPYQPGDDVRDLDWRVTARTGRAHTKLYREERERPVHLWVDYRAPMFFATRGVYKSVFAARAAALLAWCAAHHGDRVGGVIFSAYSHHEFKPARGKASVLRLLRGLVEQPAPEDPDPQRARLAALHATARLRRVARPGSLVFLISDFRHLDATSLAHIRHLAHHNKLFWILVHDPLEAQLPPPGHYRFSDGQREFTLDTRDPAPARRYRHHHQERLQRLETYARQHRIRFLSATTTDEPLGVLRAALGLRPA